MLYEDLTLGVIVYGVELNLEGLDQPAYLAFNELANSVDGVRHVVPGDTINVDHDMWSTDTFLGVIVSIADTDDVPLAFDPASIDAAKKSFETALPKLRKLDHPVIQAALETDAATHFTSCGPLSYATLALGRLIPSDDSSAATYTFHSSQDMDQMWLPEGVDGVTIASVEFTDAARLDLSPERIERWKERVPEIQDPKLYISVRYD